MCISFIEPNVKIKDFKFTNKIAEVTDLENCARAIITDSDGLSGICYFDMLLNGAYIISLEVRNDCKRLGVGSKLLNMIKEKNNKIFLIPLAGTEQFYIKNGFVKAKDEDYYVWSK